MNNQICRHCGNRIWLEAFVWFGLIFNGWRDRFGNICNDGYRHLPEKELA